MESKGTHKTEMKNKKPFPKKKIIISVIMLAFAFAGSFLIYFILQVSLNTTTPVVVVVSNSMTPNINKGDLLFVQGVEPSTIRNGTAIDQDGDVIVFNAWGLWSGAPQDPIVHRVIDKRFTGGKWEFRTKGDANSLPDPEWVSEDLVYGVVIGGIPFIGWVKIALTDSGLLIPLLVIVSALLIISIIWDIIKGDEEDDKKTKERNSKIEQIDE